MSAMDTNNYRRCVDVKLLLTFQDSAQFHFGNLVFAPNLYTSAMLFPLVDLLTSPYVEVSLLLAFSHNCAALYFAHCTVQHTAASKLLGPDLGTPTSRVQVMLPRAFPYVDVTMLASLYCSVRAH